MESDITTVLAHSRPTLFIFCLTLALAFSFEFVNGLHDTVNAVATAIYTKTLKPTVAVLLSALMNFLGVFFAGTAVAYGILKLLPTRVLEEAPIEAPLSIVIAALLSSISWNLLTWYRGIPSSSSHTLIGSILGVGLVMLILLAFIPSHTAAVPSWMVVFVALALGIGTTIGWKRIVVTVGEKIGKTHLAPIQGAAAELTAALTISLSSLFGLPVSTTHVLSSGVTGTMVAKGGGVQNATIRKILLAWVLTLSVSMAVSFLLFFLLRWLFGLSDLSPLK